MVIHGLFITIETVAGISTTAFNKR